MQTLILSGILNDDGTLQLHIPFIVDLAPQAASRATGDDLVEVSLLDASGGVLHATSIDAAVMCSAPTGSTPSSRLQRLVNGTVAMPDAATGLRLRWRDQIIYEAQAPTGSPVVRFTWKPPAGGVVSGTQHLMWDASHPDDVAMHFLVATESVDGTRSCIASLRAGPGELALACQVTLDTADFPQGTVAPVVTASDGFHQTSDRSAPFTVG